jgi:uncharacterized protein YdeI (YjbR/CyaY-like superfamily)
LEKLRTIVLNCQPTEELKWGVPCYTFQKSNIVLIHVFKVYCAFLFCKGALLDEIPALKTAFDALTPGRQRAYIFHFAAPKQSKTRESRVEKCMQQILDGKGLDDD